MPTLSEAQAIADAATATLNDADKLAGRLGAMLSACTETLAELTRLAGEKPAAEDLDTIKSCNDVRATVAKKIAAQDAVVIAARLAYNDAVTAVTAAATDLAGGR